jgi:hypothetical protein
VDRARVEPASERRGLWEAGELDARWYCLGCWSVYTERPVEEMTEYLGDEEHIEIWRL